MHPLQQPHLSTTSRDSLQLRLEGGAFVARVLQLYVPPRLVAAQVLRLYSQRGHSSTHRDKFVLIVFAFLQGVLLKLWCGTLTM